MFSPPARRSYIQRKHHLNECMAMISRTLRVTMAARNESFTDVSINQLALLHARQVEAACWAWGMRITDAEHKMLTMAKTQQFCSAIVMATVKDAAPGKLCHPRVGTPDPALDGPEGCAGLVLPERQLGIARPPNARARPDHVRRQAGGGEKLQYPAVVDAIHLDDGSFITRAFMHELLPSLTQASFCGCVAQMHVQYSTLVPDGARWRCPVSTCRGKYNIRRYSWTFHSQLALKQIAMLIAY